MTDLYLTIADQPEAVLDAIASSMDIRAAEPAIRDICDDYMADLPRGAEVLEIGCGNGASSKVFVENLAPSRFVGVDPAAGLIAKAPDLPDATFAVSDAVQSGQPDASFDIVAAHTVYSHIDAHAAALTEALRVLKPGGTLVVFDGDYATNTVALFDGDPLQAAMTATQRNLIHDLYIMRRLPALAAAAGYEAPSIKAYGYAMTENPAYLLSLLARGVDAAARENEIGAPLADAFNAEAQRRAANGTFYGSVMFICMKARKPG